MILVIADQFDVHADKVCDILAQHNFPYFRFDVDQASLQDCKCTYIDGVFRIENHHGRLSVEDVRVVWARRTHVEIPLESQGYSVSEKIWRGEWNKFISGLLFGLEHAHFLNPTNNAALAENKFRQMHVAKQVGFRVPRTTISNDRETLVSSISVKAIFKMMSQQIFITDHGIKGIYANIVSADDLSEFSAIGECPAFTQEYIEKSFEVRYTVVGSSHFACKISSQESLSANIDWRRYDLPNTPHSVISPPREVSGMIDELMRRLRLNYGALDFVVNPLGEWYFLEVNPSGQWLWIEDLTGLEISSAIAHWLGARAS